MYNQEIKERFLREYTSTKNKAGTSVHFMFDSIGVYESEMQMDISTMSVKDAIKAISHVNIGTYRTATTVATDLKAYVKWCARHSVFSNVCTELLSIKVDNIDISGNLSKILFNDEDDLVSCLKSTRPFDDGYYDVVVAVFLWLGISQSQMMNIKIDDVDLDNCRIRVENVFIPMSRKLSEILSLYSKTKSGTRMNKNGPRVVYRDDSYDLFIRRFSPPSQLGKRLTKSQIEDAIYLLNKAYVELGNEPKLTSGNILSSGALCRVRELEDSGVDVLSVKNKDAIISAFRIPAKPHEITWLYKNYKKALKL